VRYPDALTDQTQSLLFDHAPAAPPRPKRKSCAAWPEIPQEYRARKWHG
jgi:hypothetical protein